MTCAGAAGDAHVACGAMAGNEGGELEEKSVQVIDSVPAEFIAHGDADWGPKESAHSVPEMKEFFIGEEAAKKAVEKVERTESQSLAGGCALSEGGSGDDSLGTAAAESSAAASSSSPAAAAASSSSPFSAPCDEHDPFEDFSRAQVADLRDPDDQRQDHLKKLGDFARSTSRSFWDWTAKAEFPGPPEKIQEWTKQQESKMVKAPEKIQEWKQRTAPFFDRAGEKFDDLVTGKSADRRIAQLVEAAPAYAERISQEVQRVSEKKSEVREAEVVPEKKIEVRDAEADYVRDSKGDVILPAG